MSAVGDVYSHPKTKTKLFPSADMQICSFYRIEKKNASSQRTNSDANVGTFIRVTAVSKHVSKRIFKN